MTQPFIQDDIFLCQTNHTLDSGDLEVGVAKHKILRIANINPKAVVLHHMSKSTGVDDLSVILHRVADERNFTVSPEWVDEEVSSELTLFSLKRSRRTVGLFIPPFHSVYLKLRVLSGKPLLREGNMEFKFTPRAYGNMSIEYVYNVHEGSLTFHPHIYKF